MPELPDVAGFRVRFERGAFDGRVEHVAVPDDRVLDGVTPQQLGSLLHRRTFRRTARHGKFLFALAGEGRWLAMHFGMTGEIEGFDDGEDAPRFAAVVIELHGGKRVAYTSKRVLGRVTIADDVDRFVEEESLGPDALSDEMDAAGFESALSGRGGMLKTALMDQSRIAGIGNVWSDEVLFHFGRHPRTQVEDIGKNDLRALRRTMRRVLRTGARHARKEQPFPTHYLVARREAGRECPQCGGRVETVDVAGRTSYFCPGHQAQ